MFKDLLLNITLLITISLVYGYFFRFLNIERRRNKILIGISFGLITVLVMMVPVHQKTGVIYDARSIVISLVGLFSGGLAVYITGGIAAIYRIWLGGVGVIPGVSTIVVAALIGVITRYKFYDSARNLNPLFLYLFGLVVSVGMMLCQFLLPGSMAIDIIKEIWPPVLLMYPLGTVLMGLLIAEQERRIRFGKTLEESEERYRSLFEDNDVAILLIEPQTGQIVDANPAATRFYGWSREELRAKTIPEINTQPAEEIRKELAHAARSQKKYFEYQHVLADESIVDVAIYTGTIRIDDTDLLLSNIFDISKRKQAERALQEREENLRITLDSIGDAVITTDKEGRVTRMNPVAEQLTGWNRSEAIGRALSDVFQIVHAQTRAPVENPVQKVINTGQIFGLANHTMLISRDGNEYQIADSGAPIMDAEGNISGVVMVFRDVTEEYKREQAIRESEAKFRAAFKTSPDAVNLNRMSDGLYLEINDGFKNLMDYTRDEVLGKTSLELNIWKNEADREDLLNKLRKEGRVSNMEAEFLTKDGEVRIGLMSANIIDLKDEPVILSVTRDITDLKGVQEQFQKIWESAQDGMRLTNADGVITRVNPAFCEMFDFSKEAIEGQPISVLYKEKSKHIIQKHRERFRTNSIRAKTRGEFVLHNGETRWFDVSNNYVEIPGESKQVLATFRDITEYKKAEQALRESEERQDRIAHSIPGVLYDYVRWEDGRNKFLYISPDCEEIFEREAAQIMEDSNAIWDLVHPEDRDRLESEDAQANREGTIFQTEVRIITPSGEEKWIQLSSQPQKNDEEEPTVWSGVILDITDLKEAEEALRDSEYRYRVLMETAPDLILTHDMNGIIQFANSQVYSVLGYEEDSLVGTDVSDLFPPDDLEQAQQRKQSREAGDTGFKFFETSVYTQSGERIPLEVRTSPILRNGIMDEIMVVGRDIRERQKLESNLRQVQKLDAVGQLAGGIAHDFNNKLTVILGQVDFALNYMERDQALQDILSDIKTAAIDSAKLTKQLLAFARKQTTAPKILDLNETVSGMLSMLKRLIGEHIDLEWLPGKELWPVKIDPSQIDQILANLLVNSRDSIDGMGKITIETENVSISEEFVEEHPDFIPGKYVMINVSDNGSGIEQGVMDKIFEPFFTTKPQGKGTGLGLATVYGIVKQNDGFINVYSEVGVGTSFKIYLCPFEGENGTRKDPQDAVDPQTGTETILLVEDDTAILKLGELLLKQLGYTVLPANTIEEALAFAEEFSDKIHLLVTDVVMPEMNGRDLAEHLQEQYPQLKTLFMSGYTANVIAHQGVLDKGVNFLQKPFSREELGTKVREVLDQ